VHNILTQHSYQLIASLQLMYYETYCIIVENIYLIVN